MGPHPPINLIPSEPRIGISSEVPVDSASAKVCARESVSEGYVSGNNSDTAASRLEDFVTD